ncbi:MAG: sensor histidine kinase [Trueperaceae bacterium]|nr:MAG: sensor histidine kinase [Trueperaceae bacterium]
MIEHFSPHQTGLPGDEAERRTHELETLHKLAQRIAESLDSREVLTRALEVLISMGWFDCGEAFIKTGKKASVASLELCVEEDPETCSLRSGLIDDVEAAFKAGELRRGDRWQLVPIEKSSLLALVGGSGASVSQAFLEAVRDLVSASLKRTELHQRLTSKERQRSRLLQALLHAQEEERGRISRDLHDQIGQALTAILLGLDKASLEPEPQQLKQLKELTSITLGDVRRIAMDLRPSLLDELGLEAAIKRYAREIHERYALEISVFVRLPTRLSHEEETVLYRVVQEAITNVVRHAEAQRASVVVTSSNKHVKLVVEDDGGGFDPGALTPGEQLGITGMRERIELLGGSFRLESAPARGCAVFARLPVRYSYAV